MSDEFISRIDELEGLLRVLDETFDHQMRQRGFDPNVADNIALPGPLAEVYSKRLEIRDEMDRLRNEYAELRRQAGP